MKEELNEKEIKSIERIALDKSYKKVN